MLFNLLLLLLIACSQAAEYMQDPTWSTSSEFRAGQQQIISSQADKNTSPAPTYTFAFSNPFNAGNDPKIAYGFKQYSGKDTLKSENFFIQRTSLSSTQFSVQVVIGVNTKILKLSVAYLAVRHNFPYHLNIFDNMPANYNAGDLHTINTDRYSATTFTYTNTIDYSQQATGMSFTQFGLPLDQNRVILMLSSLQIEATDKDGFVSLKAEAEVISKSEYKISVSAKRAKIYAISFSVIAFDLFRVKLSGSSHINVQDGGQYAFPSEFLDNFIFAFVDLTSNYGDAQLNFDWEFDANGVNVPAQVENSDSIHSATWVAFYIKKYSCASPYHFDPDTDKCSYCDQPSKSNCLLCNCEKCAIGYANNDGQCVLCGNWIFDAGQECDDGNFQDNDGCSSSCRIEHGFTCTPDVSNTNTASSCSYTGTVELSLLYIQKEDFKNQINIYLSMNNIEDPIWANLDDLTFLFQIEGSDSIQSYSVVRKDGRLLLNLIYNENIHNSQLTVKMMPSDQYGGIYSAFQSASINFNIVPQDNEGAYYYKESTYDMAKVLQIYGFVLTIIAWLACLVEIASRKLIAIEMMAVIQITFICLIGLEELNPCMKALSSLQYSNGYSDITETQLLLHSYTDKQPKGIYLLSAFWQNFNILLILLVVSWLVALIAFALEKTIFKLRTYYTIMKKKKALGEYPLAFLLLFGYITAVSLGLQMRYALPHSNTTIERISIAESVLVLILFLVYFAFLLRKPSFFGEFVLSFNEQYKHSRKACNFYLVERLVTGIGLALMFTLKVSLLVPFVLYLSCLICIAVFRPYNEGYNNVGQVSNMAVSLTILIIYMCYQYLGSTYRHSSPAALGLPIFIMILLTIVVIYNTAIMVYQLIFRNKIQQDFKGDNLEVQETSMNIKLNVEMQFLKMKLMQATPRANNQNNEFDIMALRGDMKLKEVRQRIERLTPKDNHSSVASENSGKVDNEKWEYWNQWNMDTSWNQFVADEYAQI